jgi:hypothetical protein
MRKVAQSMMVGRAGNSPATDEGSPILRIGRTGGRLPVSQQLAFSAAVAAIFRKPNPPSSAA